MNHTLICSLPDSLPHFSELSHERQDFRRGKEIIEHKMCVEILSTTLSEIFFSTRTTERDKLNIKCVLKFHLQLCLKYFSVQEQLSEIHLT